MVTATQKVYLISGASRGLGLGLVTGLMEQDNTTVVAAARNPDKSEALQKLVKQNPERLHTVSLDTSNEASVKVSASLFVVDCSSKLAGVLVNYCLLKTSCCRRLLRKWRKWCQTASTTSLTWLVGLLALCFAPVFFSVPPAQAAWY